CGELTRGSPASAPLRRPPEHTTQRLSGCTARRPKPTSSNHHARPLLRMTVRCRPWTSTTSWRCRRSTSSLTAPPQMHSSTISRLACPWWSCSRWMSSSRTWASPTWWPGLNVQVLLVLLHSEFDSGFTIYA
uniref:Uncharacterized protein n=1 Tax=Triticum urartu TaxID=4572 RepID=A0A8R7QLJ9_TRIUA